MARKLVDCAEGDIVKVYGARNEGYKIYKVKGVHDTNFIGLLETEKTNREVVLLEWDTEEAAFLNLGERHTYLVDDRKAWPTVYPVKSLPLGTKAYVAPEADPDGEVLTFNVEV